MGFYTSPQARRMSPRPGQRPAPRPQIETLEDRVVPSIADGTILVATGPSSFSSVDQSAVPTGIVGVNPSTGAQTLISSGGFFSSPTYICEAPNGQLYVTDFSATGLGAIIRVDPNTGQQFFLTNRNFINGPIVLTWLNGFLYVANEGDGSGKIHNVVRVDPNTGDQVLITDGNPPHQGFTVPIGIQPGPGNTVYVGDEPGGYAGADPGGIWQVNLNTGVQTQITHDQNIAHPVDMAIESSGNLLTLGGWSATQTDYYGQIVRTNAVTHAQTVVSSRNLLLYVQCMTADPVGGTIYCGAIAAGTTPGAVYAVDPVTGAQRTITTGGLLNLVEGVRVFHTPVQTAATTTSVTSSADPSISGQAVTFTANVTVNGIANPTGVVTFSDGSVSLGQAALVTVGGATTATLTTASLGVGSHVITASYAGDSNLRSSSATLTQTVNSAGAAPAVGTADELFVRQLYQILLQRQPEPGGLANWTTHLKEGVSRTAVALAIDQSPESRTDQVQALYQRLLRRAADTFGLNTFVTFLGAGGTSQQVETILTSSPEYLRVQGGGTNNGFVAALYRDALNRSADPGGLEAFTRALNQGTTRNQVAAAVFGSIEHLRMLVANSYEQFLKRAPDEGGLNSFVRALRAGAREADMTAVMLSSDEFVRKI